jgi:hypothetical protein
MAATVGGHQRGGQGEAECEEEKDAGVREGVFYDDESGAPEDRAKDESEVGFDGGGMGR